MGRFLLWWFKALLRLRNLERARQDQALLDWLPSRHITLILQLGEDLDNFVLPLVPLGPLAKHPVVHIAPLWRGQWYISRQDVKFVRVCEDFRAALALAATQTARQPDPPRAKEQGHAIPRQAQ